MTKETFRRLLNTVTVQDHSRGGIYIAGMDRKQLAEIVTLAGQKLGEIAEDVRVNPEWLEAGPEQNWHFITHREFPTS